MFFCSSHPKKKKKKSCRKLMRFLSSFPKEVHLHRAWKMKAKNMECKNERGKQIAFTTKYHKQNIHVYILLRFYIFFNLHFTRVSLLLLLDGFFFSLYVIFYEERLLRYLQVLQWNCN